MESWEYCEVELAAEGHLLGAKKWSAQVVHYAPNGSHRVEKLGTDFRYDQDHPELARDAMGQVLAQLGRQGWELVRYQGARESQAREALLKKRATPESR
ncbi:MAG TPA: hypothetical protein VNL16_11770 [Chloroflexota bacterium]|nr:hypothetical protein [Chloroflexota bacterium]